MGIETREERGVGIPGGHGGTVAETGGRAASSTAAVVKIGQPDGIGLN